MNALLLFGTPGDHVEVIIGLLLGFLFVLWAISAALDFIKRKPWRHSDTPVENGMTTTPADDESDEEVRYFSDWVGLKRGMRILFADVHFHFTK